MAAAAAVLVVLSSGCASAGGQRGLSWNLGTAPPGDAQSKAVEVFTQERYQIERTEPAPNLTVYTRWRNRLPFADESALGIVEARSRFTLEARPRSRTTAPDAYNVRLTVQNQGRSVDGGDFAPLEVTPEFRVYADRIAEELRTVLAMGIRGR